MAAASRIRQCRDNGMMVDGSDASSVMYEADFGLAIACFSETLHTWGLNRGR
jgi:hypothetical protein